jgi:hypothetical protein
MTLLTDKFDRALLYASHVHGGQTRKSTNIPYIAHLLAVAATVLEYGGSEDMAIARACSMTRLKIKEGNLVSTTSVDDLVIGSLTSSARAPIARPMVRRRRTGRPENVDISNTSRPSTRILSSCLCRIRSTTQGLFFVISGTRRSATQSGSALVNPRSKASISTDN